MAHIDGTHQIDDGTPMGDIVTSLKALIAAGRGDELVEFNGAIRDGIPMDGPVHRVYPILLRFAHDGVEKSIAEVAEKIGEGEVGPECGEPRARGHTDPIKPADEATIQAWLAKAGAQAVGLRRELAPSGEFAAELEQLDDQIAVIASLMQEPLDQRESGAGKVRVLDERRLARDANEVRDLPLRDKILRTAEQNEGIAAAARKLNQDARATGTTPDAKGAAAPSFHEVNEEAKELIKQVTGKPILHAIETILEESFPGMIKAFYPRVYEHTGRYHSPRHMAVMIANVVAEMLRYGYHKSATAYRLMMPGLSYMKERRMPMFFLAPDLLEAVTRTDFDNDIDWLDLDLPYESGMLMLPKGALVHPTDGEVAMLMWARVKKGDNPSPWPGIPVSASCPTTASSCWARARRR